MGFYDLRKLKEVTKKLKEHESKNQEGYSPYGDCFGIDSP